MKGGLTGIDKDQISVRLWIRPELVCIVRLFFEMSLFLCSCMLHTCLSSSMYKNTDIRRAITEEPLRKCVGGIVR